MPRGLEADWRQSRGEEWSTDYSRGQTIRGTISWGGRTLVELETLNARVSIHLPGGNEGRVCDVAPYHIAVPSCWKPRHTQSGDNHGTTGARS